MDENGSNQSNCYLKRHPCDRRFGPGRGLQKHPNHAPHLTRYPCNRRFGPGRGLQKHANHANVSKYVGPVKTCNRRFGPGRGHGRRFRPRRGLLLCAVCSATRRSVLDACPNETIDAEVPPPRGRQRRRGGEWSTAPLPMDDLSQRRNTPKHPTAHKQTTKHRERAEQRERAVALTEGDQWGTHCWAVFFEHHCALAEGQPALYPRWRHTTHANEPLPRWPRVTRTTIQIRLLPCPCPCPWHWR